MLADLGAQALGAIIYGVYPTASASEVEYQLRDGGAVDLRRRRTRSTWTGSCPSRTACPSCACIVVVDTSAMFSYDASQDPRLERGSRRRRQATTRRSARWRRSRATIDPGDPAFIVYTSGTTGHPKGALVAHGRHLAARLQPRASTIPLLAEPQRTVVVPAALPRAGTRHRRHAAAAVRARAALRRGCRGPDADDLRGRADRALHGAALSAEVRLAGAGRRAERQPAQAARLRLGDARGPPSGTRALGGPGQRDRAAGLRARAGGRLPAAAQQARLRRARARHQRRGSAAPGDDGAVADVGRERLRDLRPDRGGRRHHHGPARALSAAGRRRHPGGRGGS